MSIITIHPLGPVYFAKETLDPEVDDMRRITTAWIYETEPPYRFGKSLRFRAGSTAVQFGICKKTGQRTAVDMDTPIEEIRVWQGPSLASDESNPELP